MAAGGARATWAAGVAAAQTEPRCIGPRRSPIHASLQGCCELAAAQRDRTGRPAITGQRRQARARAGTVCIRRAFRDSLRPGSTLALSLLPRSKEPCC